MGSELSFLSVKATQEPQFVLRSYSGQHKSRSRDKKYRLRIEFSGSQITLFENEVQHLMVVDDTYQIGQFGLRTWYTSARFEIVQALKMRPRAFLIMPFKSAFNFVHSVIEDSMVNFGLDCDRADQFAISRPVMEDVKKSIAEADLVIVDFTGKNPNVYYEAGLADAMRNDWIVLAQSNRGPELRRSSYPMHTSIRTRWVPAKSFGPISTAPSALWATEAQS